MKQTQKYGLMLILASLALMTIYSVSAQLAPPPSSGDVALFNSILQPVWKVYNLVKYVASAIAAVFLLYAGILYMSSGNDMGKRENAKQMVGYIIIGLLLIWIAPYLVQLLTS